MTPEQEYKMLLGQGVLLDMYPWLSGQWEEDRARFTRVVTLPSYQQYYDRETQKEKKINNSYGADKPR